jgi:hypothetical protein
MKRTLNFTGRSKIAREEVFITLDESQSPAVSFDVEFGDLGRFPPNSRIYVEAYYKETLQRFDYGTVGSVHKPEDRFLTQIDMTGSILFRVRVVDERGQIGLLLGAAEGLRPDGGEDEQNNESLMVLKTKDLIAVPWKVEVMPDGSKPILYVNNRIPDALARVKSDPSFFALIMPGALHQVLHRLLFEEPDDDDLEAADMRNNWIEMATDLEGTPPRLEDQEEAESWIDRVVESFCKRYELTGALIQDLEESGK